MALLAYAAGHRSELKALGVAAWPVLGIAAAGAVLALPLVLRKRRREATVAVGSAFVAVLIGVAVVAWLL